MVRKAQVKPPFSIPEMGQIASIPWNGYRVVSTFSGAGGSCLGYRLAGYRVAWANEFVPAAQQTYKANHPDSYLDERDIRAIHPREILQAADLELGQIDILDGSPPCVAFSTAGQWRRDDRKSEPQKYSDTEQRVDDLFHEFVRLIKGLQPKTFVIENVAAMVKGRSKGVFKHVLKLLKSCGYLVECRILDAQWLGVPQVRKRTIFIGVRSDLNLRPAYPDPLPYQYTVRDVLPHIIRENRGGKRHNYQTTNRPASTIVQSGYMAGPTSYFSGGVWVEAQNETGVIERRKFRIPELKKLSTFPTDFILTGSFEQQWERIGRAVPPVMMSHIAKTIQTEILDLL